MKYLFILFVIVLSSCDKNEFEDDLIIKDHKPVEIPLDTTKIVSPIKF